ncbi:MAG TPA: hypothetical protein VIL42_02375 [Sphingomicrobium sp.]|jgi:hypothetical protein
MKKLVLMAGAALMVSAAPALAKPPHTGGNGKHAQMKHGSYKAMKSGKSSRGLITTDRYGRLYALDARGSCPPGLAKKNNGCMPPGQAKKMYNVGQRYNRNFGTMWNYDQIPDYLRNQYTFDPYDRYYYGNGYLYQVDPKTLLVQQVISALLR